MTPDLQIRWQTGLAPFDGTTITICDDPRPAEVLDVLRMMVDWLSQRYPTILQFDDWHEHDGFLTEPVSLDWDTMTGCVQDLRSWKATSPEDDYVRKAIYSPTFDWLLRIDLDSADAKSLDDGWPYFDFTVAQESSASQLITKIEEQLPGYTNRADAVVHFQACYAG